MLEPVRLKYPADEPNQESRSSQPPADVQSRIMSPEVQEEPFTLRQGPVSTPPLGDAAQRALVPRNSPAQPLCPDYYTVPPSPENPGGGVPSENGNHTPLTSPRRRRPLVEYSDDEEEEDFPMSEPGSTPRPQEPRQVSSAAS